MLLCCGVMHAQIADSVDVQHYDLTLDLSSGTPFRGKAMLTLQLMRPCSEIALDLEGTADSMFIDGRRIDDNDLMHITTAGIAAGHTFTLTVHYHGSGYIEDYGFGGIHFDGDMTYNLGAAFHNRLHSIGRAVFPCRDNYNDKATYTLRIKARQGWSAECSGMLQSRSIGDDGCELSVWEIEHPVCTYLVGISTADFHRIQTTAGGYPVTIGFTTQDSAVTANVYALLDAVVPMFEQCFGPYRWGRIGYIGTAMGSMEHVNNIALARPAMASVSLAGQSTIAHELGHAWFGNLVTCETEGDMWINEGGATFTSEVAREATHGRRASNATYQQNLDKVLRNTHHDDGAYRALHDMPHNYTYGSTTYDKGGLVWHSLRGYLGDSLFYATIRTLMERCAFTSIDAYRLRDSLSAYSGVDLSGFFDFHVFSPGFNDYSVSFGLGEGSQGWTNISITIQQNSVATDNLMRQNRVPVTFFSHLGQRHKVWFSFQGTDTVIANYQMPFDPYFCVLDLDCEISDAVTVDSIDVTGSSGTIPTDMAFFAVRGASAQYHGRYYVEHHYARPSGIDTTTGVIRPSNRYWVVRSRARYNQDLSGRFRYIRDGYSDSEYPHLDEGFYKKQASLDSIVLLWRKYNTDPWTVVSKRHVGTANDGYFVFDNLLTGEYTLAVVDTNLVTVNPYPLSIADHQTLSSHLNLFPNPIHSGDSFSVEAPTSEPYSVTVIDASGRQAWHRNGCNNGDPMTPKLAPGTYTVKIENNSISLTSKIIVL